MKAIKIIEQALKSKYNLDVFCRSIYSKKKDRIELSEIRARINPEVRKENGYKCSFCNQDVIEQSKSNTIHHIIPERYSGDYDKKNLLVICCKCHILLEKLISKVEKEAIKHTLIYLRRRQTENGKN